MPKAARRLSDTQALPGRKRSVPSSTRRGLHKIACQGQNKTAPSRGSVEIETARHAVPDQGQVGGAVSISPVDVGKARSDLPDQGQSSAAFSMSLNDAGESRVKLPDQGRKRNALPASPFESEAASRSMPDKGQGSVTVSLSPDSLQDLITKVREWQIRRKHHIRVATKIVNGIGALVRRNLGWKPDHPDAEDIKKRATKIVKAYMAGDEVIDPNVTLDMLADLDVAKSQLKIAEKAESAVALHMEKVAKKLPGYDFVKAVKGFGDLAFAVLVGEVGDLAAYAPGRRCPKKAEKIWLRLGLAPYSGSAMSTWRKEGGLSADEWTMLGYSPRRRAEVYAVVEDPLFRHQSSSKGPYYSVYLKRREHTAITHPEWRKAQSHADAKRVMVKELVSDLWSEWRRANRTMPDQAIVSMPAANIDPCEGREQASSALPDRAKTVVPAPKKSPSRGRRQATARLPVKAESSVPDA